MSKIIDKFKSLSGKATRKEGNIPSGVDLSHLKAGLFVLSNIAEAAGITPLSKTAEIIKGIVEIVEKKGENKEDIKDFGQSTTRLLQILNGIVSTSGGKPMNDELYQHVKEFQHDLEDILQTLEKLAQRPTLKAFWHAERDGKVLAGFKEKSDRFVTSLNLHVSLEVLHLILAGTDTRQNATITYESIKLATPMAPRLLCQGDQVHLAILGAGGMGKTSLALHIMEHAKVGEKFQEHAYFVPCEMMPDAPSIIQGLLQVMELFTPEGKNGYGIMEAYLKSSHRPILLVLDNFETPWHSSTDQNAVQNLIEKICGQRQISVIVTMRGAEGPGNIEWNKLGGQSGLPPLTLEAARETFLSISKDENGSEDLDALLKELDCMPLAVLLMAQLSKRLSLDDLINDWQNRKTNMLRNGNQDGRLTSMNTSIDLSIKMLSQDAGFTKILPVLAFLPNGIPFWTLNLPKLSPELGDDFKMTVMSIIDSGLIYEETKSLKMLSPIREYVQIKHPVTQHHLDQINNFYVQLLHNLPQNRVEAQDLLDGHTANIQTIFTRQIDIAPQEAHLKAMYCFAEFTKFYPQILAMLDKALSHNWDGGQQEHINIRFQKVYIMRFGGFYREAISEILEIQTINLQIDPNDQKVQIQTLANCHQKLGEIYYLQDQYSQAIEKLTNAQTEFEKIGDRLGAAQCLRSLGDIHRMQTECPQAIEELTNAQTEFEKIGDRLGAAQCLRSLGNIHRMQNEYPQAIEKLTNAQTEFQKIGDRLGLHNIHSGQGEYAQAIEKLTNAQTEFEKIGDRLGAAQCLRNLGDIHCKRNEYPQAIEKLTKAQTEFERIGDRSGAAWCLQFLGDVHRMQNEYPQAIEKLTNAKSEFEKIGSRLGAAYCLESLADIHSKQAEYSEAIEKFTNAQTEFEKFGNKQWAAWCLKRLGHIHQELSRSPSPNNVNVLG
ncbi:TPR-like protein [Gymnopus androsaceus JB14]|uniref:TPR-like protein n=1 Tax=Gymnopus androsaceus JB14 TaxID=1447944 RepID=A0A6A4GRN8_9AGAR|nr:TPR-like protein [Gymnopus androsaceus JB14]